MNKNSGFGDVTNCNSLNSSVVSSPTVNSIRRNSFYKLTNVLLLLFLVFGSCVVSFGMNVNENKDLKKNEINDLKKNEIINQQTNYDTNKDICNKEARYFIITIANKEYKMVDNTNVLHYILLSFAPWSNNRYWWV